MYHSKVSVSVHGIDEALCKGHGTVGCVVVLSLEMCTHVLFSIVTIQQFANSNT